MGKVTLIAEIGVNHNGDPALAERMIDAAADAGADMVKFQTFKAEAVICAHAPKAAYQEARTGSAESQLEMVRRYEFDENVHRRLFAYAARRGIEFLSTPFDLQSIDLLQRMGLSMLKIPSGEVTNLPYLRKIGALRKKIIMSTGMATVAEVKDALAVLIEAGTGKDDIVLLQCTTAYPAPAAQSNLRAMRTLETETGCRVGFSDHTQGIAVAIAAAALGAAVIEKHFTLDRTMPGPDHAASLEPAEFAEMVRAVRTAESALGDGRKVPVEAELANMSVARKSIVAARAIIRGETFSEENLTVKRPGTGVSPMRWDLIVGTVADRDYSPDEAIVA
jgi:N,N'-diacetyllegionaminate synthase